MVYTYYELVDFQREGFFRANSHRKYLMSSPYSCNMHISSNRHLCNPETIRETLDSQMRLDRGSINPIEGPRAFVWAVLSEFVCLKSFPALCETLLPRSKMGRSSI